MIDGAAAVVWSMEHGTIKRCMPVSPHLLRHSHIRAAVHAHGTVIDYMIAAASPSSSGALHGVPSRAAPRKLHIRVWIETDLRRSRHPSQSTSTVIAPGVVFDRLGWLMVSHAPHTQVPGSCARALTAL
jgi:hypothetical protein